jgi:hypothetical protein
MARLMQVGERLHDHTIGLHEPLCAFRFCSAAPAPHPKTMPWQIIALLRKSSLRPDVRFTLDDAIKQAEHGLDEYNALLTRYGRSGNAARP